MNGKIIDVHAHLPSDLSLISDLVRHFSANAVNQVFVSSLGRANWPAVPDEDWVAQCNQDTFDLCRQYPDFFKGYVYLNPNLNWEKEILRWQSSPHFVGVKLWICLKDESRRHEICLPILRHAVAYGFPVLIHGFFRIGETPPGELTPADTADLAQKIPNVKIIMAHLGGNWERGLKAVANQTNVFVDCSGFFPARGCIERAVEICGIDRVLYGSDAPCRTVQSQIYKVLGAEITNDQRRRILSENALALFKSI